MVNRLTIIYAILDSDSNWKGKNANKKVVSYAYQFTN
jgi:hypothetical protein